MSPHESEQADIIAQQIDHKEHNSSRIRAAVGLGFIAVGFASTALLATDALHNARFTQEMPFNESAQHLVNQIDEGLGLAGEIALPLSLVGIGAVKIGATRNNRLRSIDKRSSQELSDEGHARANVVRRGLRTVAAGSMPVVVAASAAVGALTTGIGVEITDGPTRPITSFDNFAPGNTMITQFKGAMPMLESTITSGLTQKIEQQASAHGVTTTSMQLGLNSIENGSQSLTGLTIGVESDKLPAPLQMEGTCATSIPVLIDSSAGINKGTHLKVNGHDVMVVGTANNISAINRVGLVMDQAALEKCINENTEVNSHAIVLDTDPATAQEILNEAGGSEAATVITKEQYEANSKDFWESNVKPITNTFALVGLMTNFIAMGGYAVSRMLRSRRELAAKLAAGESTNQFRATELVRAAKDGVLGSTVGVGLAAALTVPVNALESGMRVGLGVHEAMVAYAVGILGSVGGTLVHVIRPKKVVDPSEHTRV